MNHELIRLTTRFSNSPLLITPDEATSIFNYLNSRNETTVISLGADILPTRQNASGAYMKNSNGVAHIEVIGSLSHRDMGLDSLCSAGVSSYTAIRRNIDLALNDDAVKVILLELDTNGGEAAGCFDLANYISMAKEKKPIYGFASEKALSAGYAIISACTQVILPDSGFLGSIGVVTVHQDVSQMLSKEGIKITPLYCGADKVLGSGFEPLSEDAKSKIMVKLERAYEGFTQLVSTNRGISVEDVKKTEAGVFGAEESIRLGLADKIMSFSELEEFVLEEARNTSSQNSRAVINPSAMKAEQHDEGETSMSTEKEVADLRTELAALKAEKKESEVAQLAASAEKYAVLGVDPKAYAEQVHTLGADSTFVTMMTSAMEQGLSALTDKEELQASVTELTEKLTVATTEKEQLSSQAQDAEAVVDAAKSAVEASAAMQELGASEGGEQTVGLDTNQAQDLTGLMSAINTMFPKK